MIDKKLFRFILLFYLLAFSNALFNGVLQKYYGGAFTSLSWMGMAIYFLFNYGSKFIFILFAIWFTKKKLIDQKISILSSVLIHTFITFIFTIYSSFLILLYQNLFMGYDTSITAEVLFQQVIYGSSFNFFIYFSLIAIVYAYYYLLRQKQQELNRSKLSSQLLDAKINALQSQLQPHFLFNALNDISSLMDMNIDKAQNAIADLSEMLRLTLSIKDTKYIYLKKEISILKKYLDIEKIRFDKKLEVNLDVDDSLLKEYIPPLILQPIVENSIKHGFSFNVDSLIINISVKEFNNYINFKILNNGKSLGEKFNYGIGLTNVISRIDTLYNGDFEFEIKNNENMGVVTTILIPKRKEIN
jgi:sensor histidine kinase YesM